MKAVQVTGPDHLVVTDVPEPVTDRMALVRSRQVGICGTDVKVLHGAIPGPRPITMGHEMVGEVVEIPAGFDVTPGDRVLVDPATSCGHCDLCWANRPHICRNGGLLGRDSDGVFAEYVAVAPERLIPVPDTISSRASGLLQVLGTCVHAQKAVRVFPGQTVAVIGLGVAGQLMVQLLRERGIDVVGITRSAWKRDLATAHGAMATSDPKGASRLLLDLTNGRGPDLVVEAAGTETTVALAIELVKTGGEVLVFGTLTGGDQGLPYYQLYLKELTIYNPRAAVTADYADGVRLAAAGRLELESIVTHQLDLSRAEEAFSLFHDSSSLKVLMSLD